MPPALQDSNFPAKKKKEETFQYAAAGLEYSQLVRIISLMNILRQRQESFTWARLDI